MKAIFAIILTSLFLFGCQETLEPEKQSSAKGESAQKKLPEKKQKEASVTKKKQKKNQTSKQKKRQSKKQKKREQKRSKRSLIFLVKKIPVKQEKTAGYDRDAFVHWSDLDGNGCDTREDVLRRENLRPKGNRCFDDRGLWYSVYDGVRTRDASSFDVDHMVPLAEAYASGAWKWSEKKRELYANDSYGPSLIAVSASSNREKSDRDPAEWLPPRRKYLCPYLKNWVFVKYRWRLAVDRRERQVILRLLKNCPQKKISRKPPRLGR